MKRYNLLMGTMSLIALGMFSNSSQSHAEIIQFQNNSLVTPSQELDKHPRGVTMAMIPDFQEKPALTQSIQPIPLHTAELVNFIDKEKK